jgi:hypothetical protein
MNGRHERMHLTLKKEATRYVPSPMSPGRTLEEWCAEDTHTDRLIALKSHGYRQCGFAAITQRYTRQRLLCGSMPCAAIFRCTTAE